MEFQIVSVKEQNMKDRQTGKPITLYQCFLVDEVGGIGSLYSSRAHVTGEVVSLHIMANRDGKMAVRIKE